MERERRSSHQQQCILPTATVHDGLEQASSVSPEECDRGEFCCSAEANRELHQRWKASKDAENRVPLLLPYSLRGRLAVAASSCLFGETDDACNENNGDRYRLLTITYCALVVCLSCMAGIISRAGVAACCVHCFYSIRSRSFKTFGRRNPVPDARTPTHTHTAHRSRSHHQAIVFRVWRPPATLAPERVSTPAKTQTNPAPQRTPLLCRFLSWGLLQCLVVRLLCMRAGARRMYALCACGLAPTTSNISKR